MSEQGVKLPGGELPLAEGDLPRVRFGVVLTADRMVTKRYDRGVWIKGTLLREYMISPNKIDEHLPVPIEADERLVEIKFIADGGPALGTIYTT